MTRDASKLSLVDLVAERRRALLADGRWTHYSDSETSEAFERLEALQANLLSSDFSTANNRMIALELLLEGEDHPNFADDFKNSLFYALQAIINSDDTPSS